MSKKCIVCGREIENGKNKEEHHISYPVKGFPEVKVALHKKCHLIVHNTNHYEGLKPRKGHSKKYYDNGTGKTKKKTTQDVVAGRENKKPTKSGMIGDRIGELVCRSDNEKVKIRISDFSPSANERDPNLTADDVKKELEKRDVIKSTEEWGKYIYDKEKLWEKMEDNKKYERRLLDNE